MEASMSIEILGPQLRKSLKSFNKTQWWTLVCLSCGNIGLGLCASLQSPFFPKEAEMKGATPSEYGLVFGLFYLTTFIFSPLCGRMIKLVSPEYLRDCGMLIVGICFILFGFLDKSPPGGTFLRLAYIVRIAEGIGNAAFKTSNFIIIAIVFPDHMATVLGTIETMNGLGIILGPPIGSALYELGGYILPFVSSGISVLIVGLVTHFVLFSLPEMDGAMQVQIQKNAMTFQKFIFNPLVILHISLLISSSSCLGFNMATLEPSLRQFNLSPVRVGFLFVIGGAMYGISSPIWGYFADNRVNPKILSVIASFFLAICFTLIGPAPFLHLEPKVHLMAISLFVFGIGFGGTRVIAFVDCLNDAQRKGLPSDLSTTGVISGTFTASYGIGFFLGPTLGGIMFENFGFPLSTSLLAGIMYLESLAFLVFFLIEKYFKGSHTTVLSDGQVLLQGLQ